jgi:hypothetical protein
MLHDADLPMTQEVARRWALATDEERAMAYVSMGFTETQPTRAYFRERLRGPMKDHVSYMALRVAGALNGRIDLRNLYPFKPA